MKKALALIALVAATLLIGVLPAAAQDTVELVGVDGFADSCQPANNVAGFTVRFNVPGDVTVRAQAYTEFYRETVVIGTTAGGGEEVGFTMNAPELPENTVVQYTITNGDPDNAVHVSVNCTTGAVYLERLLGADGRLFAGEDLLVVVYPRLTRSGDPYLDFYTVNPEDNSRGRLTLRVDADTLAELPETPSRNIEIASTPDNLATLYYLTSGEFQVNYAPDEEGKIAVVIFDALSPTRVIRADY